MSIRHIPMDYQMKMVEKWAPVLNTDGGIKDAQKRISTALLLENTVNDSRDQMMMEADAFGMGAQAGSSSVGTGGAMGQEHDFSVNDSRIPTTVLPLVRRVFPELIAHDLVGVQAMTTPVGYAYALRCLYGAHGKGQQTDPSVNTELGFNRIDTRFTGTSASNNLTGDQYTGQYATIAADLGLTNNLNLSAAWDATVAGAWASFSGDNTLGTGASLEESEYWGLKDDFPQAKFHIEKAIIDAKTRKIGTSYSLELAEDLMKMHGLNADNELTGILGNELRAEIDRQLLGQMVKCAITDSASRSTWTPLTADGRHQLERIGTLFTHMLLKSQQISMRSRRGSATWAVCSPTVIAMLERLSDYKSWDAANPNVGIPNQANVAKVGSLRGNMTIVRDSLAAGDYILMGYKGNNNYDTGVVFCPYIPIQMLRATRQETFAPQIGLRTRYGLHANIFGASRYYQYINVTGLTSALSSGTPTFISP